MDNLTAHLNQMNPTDSIKFTYEKEHEVTIPFLDTPIHVVHKPDGSVKLLSYCKSTHPDQYLNFASHHLIHHKLGVVRTDVWTEAIMSQQSKETKNKRNRKCACEYPNWTFNHVERQMDRKQKKRLAKKKDATTHTKGLVIIPYVEKLTETVTRIFRKQGIATALRPHTALREMLVHPKDK